MHMPAGSCIPGKPYLVTIFGAAGSGKSELAKAVAGALGEAVAARVPADDFFVPRERDEPLVRYLDRPLTWDWPLLRDRLASSLGTNTTTPDADFETFTRRAESGGRPLPIRPVMIVDAMVPFPDADLVVRLDVPEDVRRERIILRDERWGTRVQDRWAHLEATWETVPSVAPHLVLDGTRCMEESVAVLAGTIRENIMENRRDGR